MSIKEKSHCYLRLLEKEGFCCAFIDERIQGEIVSEIQREVRDEYQLIKIDIRKDISKEGYREDEQFGWYQIFQQELFSNQSSELTEKAKDIKKNHLEQDLNAFLVKSFELLSHKKIILVLSNIESIVDTNYSKLEPGSAYYLFQAIQECKTNRLQFLVFASSANDSQDPESDPIRVYNKIVRALNKSNHASADQTIFSHQVVEQKTDSDSGSSKQGQVGTRIEHRDERQNDRRKVWLHVIELPWLRSLIFSSEEVSELQRSVLLIILIFSIAALVGLVTWWFSTFVPIPEPTPIPTQEPTPTSTQEPTPTSTQEPTPTSTQEPTPIPTQEPTPIPTQEPTPIPTQEPTPIPTQEPTPIPTQEPTPIPTQEPTPIPTQEPTPIPDLPPCSKSQIFEPCDPNQ